MESVAKEVQGEHIVNDQQSTATSTSGKDTKDNAVALPDGWMEAVDPASGKVYCYNQVMGENQCDHAVVKDNTVVATKTNDEKETVKDEAAEVEPVNASVVVAKEVQGQKEHANNN